MTSGSDMVVGGRADQLGLSILAEAVHESLSRKWQDEDVIDREQAMADYVETVMAG